MKTLCYSVRLESLTRISDKAYKAVAFDGSSDVIPASQVFGQDWEVQKCDAYWISAWILSKKNLQYSSKKQAWFDENGKWYLTESSMPYADLPQTVLSVFSWFWASGSRGLPLPQYHGKASVLRLSQPYPCLHP